MLMRPAERGYRTWIIDSSRWDHYRPRADDIVIATYPKCGTTWMQRIVSLLVFQSPEPRSVMHISPWIDRRFPEPVEDVMARIDSQGHRRFLKSHLPADGLPLFGEVRYIHVARHGLDAFMSFHNHATGYTPEARAALDRAGLEDPLIARPYPDIPADAAEFYRMWISQGIGQGQEDGTPSLSYFAFQRSWWEERQRPNVLFVHYNDLKADLEGEMRRIAEFLGISVPAHVWPQLVSAATFDAMRRNGATLLGKLQQMFVGGAERFINKGTNERWRGVLNEQDLARFEAKVRTTLAPQCAEWLANGRLGSGDPRLAA